MTTKTSSPAQIARDVMSSPAISVPATRTVSETAQMMLDHQVGGLPVVDASGALIGMVSDGDLLGRRPEDSRRDWWLSLLSRGAGTVELPPQRLGRPVSEVMSAPVVTISPSTPLDVVAEMLQVHKVKRLPVVENNRLVGVVSRTDLVGLHPAADPDPDAQASGRLIDFLESLIGGASLRGGVLAGLAKARERAAADSPVADRPEFSAEALRRSAEAFEAEHRDRHEAERLAQRRERERMVKAMIDRHVTLELWRSLVEHAEIAAGHGESEVLMLRFPCELCSDGGRMIDVAEPGWETTLRGEAAEMYARWRDELKPAGFHLSARVMSYLDGGVLGDVGLFLSWGK